MRGDPARETERVKRLWDAHARGYDRAIRLAERLLVRDGRRWVCSRASGEVLEVAVGTGLNLPLYPEGVRLTGIDISPAMLARARERAAALGRKAALVEGDAQALPFPDASFDTVVCTLSLCSIPDDRRAVAEMKRVLRPGGRLLLLDHVRSSSRFWRALQRALDPLFVRLAGDHLLRRPLEHVVAEGLRVERAERYAKGMVERVSARRERGSSNAGSRRVEDG
ncbi:phosphatidylethanolamine N-methyltransferase / phosphatidyl-N-methylethanolamine N-methyltransferase [Rubrobacter xylanophilus DSM 9941]|uniref:Phosphatidylethanolamine N-methyltransferase / phosphatidyl-N-methylethanolamine N-methyltransferase n=1 Tax=Rubrobacter xylanophilus (strain DSM 9941 / JCM 11954 / NBRC 16129 / PRD-1) TaxID=266117 RepID=Q1AZS7_RUBXD|nr:class I SAM-dependent methyltransferase [Rubrobacter xylanophilus]ABG03101.1 phosphatidylethanolamine N-methyltransferase / phosphatidyl-N-methylethanolamine N-methyltransferase [Rubrobacter xylanophilus DSM 9941]